MPIGEASIPRPDDVGASGHKVLVHALPVEVVGHPYSPEEVQENCSFADIGVGSGGGEGGGAFKGQGAMLDGLGEGHLCVICGLMSMFASGNGKANVDVRALV